MDGAACCAGGQATAAARGRGAHPLVAEHVAAEGGGAGEGVEVVGAVRERVGATAGALEDAPAMHAGVAQRGRVDRAAAQLRNLVPRRQAHPPQVLLLCTIARTSHCKSLAASRHS